MPRKRIPCEIQRPPRISGLTPIPDSNGNETAISLFIDEYEVIRLLDYEDLTQEEAAEIMKISRPTLTRIYERARKKIARVLVECQTVSIEKGISIYTKKWIKCKNCGVVFNNPLSKTIKSCIICDSSDLKTID